MRKCANEFFGKTVKRLQEEIKFSETEEFCFRKRKNTTTLFKQQITVEKDVSYYLINFK